MAAFGFTVVERFDPTRGESWTGFLKWSRLLHLTEVVSLDCCLCPGILKELSDEDLERVHPDIPFFGFFSDPRWAEVRTPVTRGNQFLAVLRDPREEDATQSPGPAFEFAGYELLEDLTQISALVNCGGFDKAFKPSDLSTRGLIESYEKAREVQSLLLRHYPEEPHAGCDLYAIWRQR